VDEGLSDLVRRALAEDSAGRDVTTLATVPEGARGRARLVAHGDAVIAGLEAFAASFAEQQRAMGSGTVEVTADVADGARVSAGDSLARVDGDLRTILTAERTALNFVQHLSGIATLTARFVAAAPGVQIRDTRKTIPGMRAMAKAAVRAGGGTNHRADLSAAILIKDNHIAAAGGIEPAVKAARAAGGWIEVECDTLEQVRAAVDAGADEVLLDNMSVDQLREAVGIARGRARTEASGGVTLETVAAIATTGVDAISVGALTHSAPAADFGLDVEGA